MTAVPGKKKQIQLRERVSELEQRLEAANQRLRHAVTDESSGDGDAASRRGNTRLQVADLQSKLQERSDEVQVRMVCVHSFTVEKQGKGEENGMRKQ